MPMTPPRPPRISPQPSARAHACTELCRPRERPPNAPPVLLERGGHKLLNSRLCGRLLLLHLRRSPRSLSLGCLVLHHHMGAAGQTAAGVLCLLGLAPARRPAGDCQPRTPFATHQVNCEAAHMHASQSLPRAYPWSSPAQRHLRLACVEAQPDEQQAQRAAVEHPLAPLRAPAVGAAARWHGGVCKVARRGKSRARALSRRSCVAPPAQAPSNLWLPAAGSARGAWQIGDPLLSPHSPGSEDSAALTRSVSNARGDQGAAL